MDDSHTHKNSTNLLWKQIYILFKTWSKCHWLFSRLLLKELNSFPVKSIWGILIRSISLNVFGQRPFYFKGFIIFACAFLDMLLHSLGLHLRNKILWRLYSMNIYQYFKVALHHLEVVIWTKFRLIKTASKCHIFINVCLLNITVPIFVFLPLKQTCFT